MHKNGTSWSPSPKEIEALRQEVLGNRLTYTQIGIRKGVTTEWVRQVLNLGNIASIRRQRLVENQENIRRLVEAGKSDKEIAAEMAVSTNLVVEFRLEHGLRRPNPLRKHTRQSAINCALLWYKRYGYTPAATDWSPAQAKKVGQIERAERFLAFRAEFEAPLTSVVLGLFPSWSEFIRQTELPAPLAGPAGHGRWKTGRL